MPRRRESDVQPQSFTLRWHSFADPTTPSVDLMSSPDPLNDPTLVIASPTRRASRADIVQGLTSTGTRRMMNAADDSMVGEDTTLMSISNPSGTRRKLFQSIKRSPTTMRRRMQTTTTTTTVPLKGFTEEEKEGGERVPNGTPMPSRSVKRRAGTPMHGTPRRPRTLMVSEEEAAEDARRGGFSASAIRPGTARRRRLAMLPDELAEATAEAAANRSENDVDLVRVPLERDAAHSPPASDRGSDIWMTTMDDQPTPKAAAGNGGYGELAPADSDRSDVSEAMSDQGPRNNDTIAQGEDFSMIFMDSIPSLAASFHGNSSMMRPAAAEGRQEEEEEELGDETNLIINNTLESIRQEVAQSDASDGGSEPVEEGGDETGMLAGPVTEVPSPSVQRGAGLVPRLSPSPWWSRKAKKMGSSPLRHQVLRSSAKRASLSAVEIVARRRESETPSRSPRRTVSWPDKGKARLFEPEPEPEPEDVPYEDEHQHEEHAYQGGDELRATQDRMRDEIEQERQEVEEAEAAAEESEKEPEAEEEEEEEAEAEDEPGAEEEDQVEEAQADEEEADEEEENADVMEEDPAPSATNISYPQLRPLSPEEEQEQEQEEDEEENADAMEEDPSSSAANVSYPQLRSPPEMVQPKVRIEDAENQQDLTAGEEPRMSATASQSALPIGEEHLDAAEETSQEDSEPQDLPQPIESRQQGQPIKVTPVNQMSSPVQSPQSAVQEAMHEKMTRPVLSSIVRAGRVLQNVTSDPPSPGDRNKQLGSPFRSSGSKESLQASKEMYNQRIMSKSPPKPLNLRRSDSRAKQDADAVDELVSEPEPVNQARRLSTASAAGSMRITPPDDEDASWVENEEPLSPSLRQPIKELVIERPIIRDRITENPFGRRQPVAIGQLDGAAEEDTEEESQEEEDDETDIWEFEARRESPNQGLRPPALPKPADKVAAGTDEVGSHSMVSQRQQPAKEAEHSINNSRFDLSAFFSSPAAIPGMLADKFFPNREKTPVPPARTRQAGTGVATSSMFPPQQGRGITSRHAHRTDLFSPAQAKDAQQLKENGGAGDMRTPEPRHVNQAVFPSSARTAATATPPRMQLSHADIHRWQQETSNASDGAADVPRHMLRPLPAKNASPKKSSLRSPLKPRTPGRVVEFTSSVLSPAQPPPAQPQPQRQRLSETEWTRRHWLLLDSLMRRRKKRPFEGDHDKTAEKLLGKTVKSQGRALTLERWHLDTVDAFKAEVGGWDEGAVAKRLVALILGEERRARMAAKKGRVFH